MSLLIKPQREINIHPNPSLAKLSPKAARKRWGVGGTTLCSRANLINRIWQAKPFYYGLSFVLAELRGTVVLAPPRGRSR